MIRAIANVCLLVRWVKAKYPTFALRATSRGSSKEVRSVPLRILIVVLVLALLGFVGR
jgi:hypothetical protein